MMKEREALLRAVCESPDDDTPRLVYADWLDENGEPERAEFIRVQIALARGSDEPRLKKREQKLLAKFGNVWLEPVQQYIAEPWGFGWECDERGWEFDRGFLSRLFVAGETGEEFFTAADNLFQEYPLRTLWFPQLKDFGFISEWAGLQRVTEVMFHGWCCSHSDGGDVTWIGELFTSPHAGNLRALHLRGTSEEGAWLTLDVIQELAGSTTLRALRYLNLSGNIFHVGSRDDKYELEWVRTLLGAELFPQLDELHMYAMNIHDGSVEIIANSPSVATLKHLNLSCNEIGEPGARALLNSPYLGSIQVLDLRSLYDIDLRSEPMSGETWDELIERFGTRVLL
jgi:uncharacterized protein (TIGR02996 family)